MIKFNILVILIGDCLSSLLAAADPTIWISLKPSASEKFVLIYREETESKLYDLANGTIIPMALYHLSSSDSVFWGISPLSRHDGQVEFDILLKNSFGKEGRVIHNFFSKGDDRNLIPLVIENDKGFKIQIPEENGHVRNIIIQRGSGIESFAKMHKVSPLMPVFTWKQFPTFKL
jgi:hypothetical protein